MQMAQGESGVLEPDGWSVLLPIAGRASGGTGHRNDLAQEFTVSVKYLNSMISKVRDINVVLCVNSNAVRGVATRGCGADHENRIVAGRYPQVGRDYPSAMRGRLP
jgi:hypothetical protein